MNIRDLKPPYTLIKDENGLRVERPKPIYVEISGKAFKVMPQNTMYAVTDYYGKKITSKEYHRKKLLEKILKPFKMLLT